MRNSRLDLPDAELKRRFKTYLKHDKNITATAKVLGISRRTVRTSIDHFLARGLDGTLPDGIELPEFPDSDAPIDKIIGTLTENNARRRASYDSHTWFPIKVNDKKPIGIVWFGDPHVDDDGCDWGMLNAHIALCQQPGIYGVNVGDTTNNWAGRLVKKYADQETSAKTAVRLAEWFMLDAGIRWLVWLLGNHDAWGDGASILMQMAKRHGTQKLVLHDWEARFSLNFPNGVKINIWVAHNFPGDSMWNPLHGVVKAARFGPDVHLLVCGDKHNWGISHWELADKGTCPVMIRTRGYKFTDDYTRRIGKTEQSGGSAIFTIINPLSVREDGRIMAFVDIDAGVDYLKFLRSK